MIRFLCCALSGPWSSGASNAESDEADDSPRLDGIDSELFSFVKRAEDATRGRGAMPYYRLHAIIPPASVSNVLCITVSVVPSLITRLWCDRVQPVACDGVSPPPVSNVSFMCSTVRLLPVSPLAYFGERLAILRRGPSFALPVFALQRMSHESWPGSCHIKCN